MVVGTSATHCGPSRRFRLARVNGWMKSMAFDVHGLKSLTMTHQWPDYLRLDPKSLAADIYRVKLLGT